MTTYTVELVEDGDDLVLPFPADVLEKAGWKEGDVLDWKDNGDGSFSLSKKETELVLVEAVSMFRIRYLVEVPKGKADFALDSVTCQEVEEFSQKHIGETITSHRVVSTEEALDIHDQDNPECKHWLDESKLRNILKVEN